MNIRARCKRERGCRGTASATRSGWTRTALAWAALACLTAFGRAASAEYRVTERTEEYIIRGNDQRDLREQLDRLGTAGADGKTFDANTASRIRWDYTYATSSDECRIGTVLVLLDIRYRMPHWDGQESAPRDLREAWDSYLVKLAAHERSHGDLARKTAGDLERALLNMPGRRYCDEVGAAANDLAERAIRDLQQQDAAYDERTHHGSTEGAVFPP